MGQTGLSVQLAHFLRKAYKRSAFCWTSLLSDPVNSFFTKTVDYQSSTFSHSTVLTQCKPPWRLVLLVFRQFHLVLPCLLQNIPICFAKYTMKKKHKRSQNSINWQSFFIPGEVTFLTLLSVYQASMYLNSLETLTSAHCEYCLYNICHTEVIRWMDGHIRLYRSTRFLVTETQSKTRVG